MNLFIKYESIFRIKKIIPFLYRTVIYHTRLSAICLFFIINILGTNAQSLSTDKKQLIYIDNKGVIRSTTNNEEVSFFGVNYTTPFAFAYRAHKYLGVSHEKAIEQDVYHLARLGIDAFRVHVWDIEITDSLGNLLQNEHLRLFDFLIAKLKERNIRILLTPIAYWGNGYPEKDIHTNGFSNYYNKDQAYRNPEAIAAQENYLKQILTHVNPYTHQTYCDDPDIIGIEVCNEPSHSGESKLTTDFINKMVEACRSVKWDKPIFYNTSQNSPDFSDAMLEANINGGTFQWYPAGLVRGHELQGNFLPYVDKYNIPFRDNPRFKHMAKAVYEFDAADILKSYMYPAIARSFKEAGFQWATQFAYDPLAEAYSNSEYQTHYLNLAYTPSKAISLLIASKAFHKIPLNKSYGSYPNDTAFDVFRVSYMQSCSEMNSEDEFYYSNNTNTKPININKLKHVAGYGSSPVVRYKGYGAYFLDKLENGIWRLEIMPDAINILDPFEKPSLKKEVTRIEWKNQSIEIYLPDLGNDFSIKGINSGNTYAGTASGSGFEVYPGSYLIIRKGLKNNTWKPGSIYGNIHIDEFVAPKSFSNSPFVVHKPFLEVTAGKPSIITAKVVGIDTMDKVVLVIGTNPWTLKNIPFVRKSIYDFEATIPADVLYEGLLSYRILIEKGNKYITFPDNYPGNPTDWDCIDKEFYTSMIPESISPLEIFDATNDFDNIERSFHNWGKNDKSIGLVSTAIPGRMAIKVYAKNLKDNEHTICFRSFFGDKLKGRISEISKYDEILLRARVSDASSIKLKIMLIAKDGASYSAFAYIDKEFKDYHIPINSFVPDSMVLIPRPYPGFLPFLFKADMKNNKLELSNTEVMEIAVGPGMKESEYSRPVEFEIEYVWFNKSN